MTQNTPAPTLAQCPACGHETLTTEPTGWRAIGPRLTCTAEGCDYYHDITAPPAPDHDPCCATAPARHNQEQAAPPVP